MHTFKTSGVVTERRDRLREKRRGGRAASKSNIKAVCTYRAWLVCISVQATIVGGGGAYGKVYCGDYSHLVRRVPPLGVAVPPLVLSVCIDSR